MYLDASAKIFVGCRLSSKLRMALDQTKEEDRSYFDHPESPYLQIIEMGEERWIGKVVEPGIKVGEAEDLRNNVLSILRRVAPDLRHQSSSIRIFAALESQASTGYSPESVADQGTERGEPYFG
ncbi:MAG: hypothetical protein AAF355_15830 [Myxococcota bacterium]